MGGTYRRLRPGRYHLVVKSGAGPAGVRRPDGEHIEVGVEGGLRDFSVRDDEQVFYWWRGPEPDTRVSLERQRLRPRVPARSAVEASA